MTTVALLMRKTDVPAVSAAAQRMGMELVVTGPARGLFTRRVPVTLIGTSELAVLAYAWGLVESGVVQEIS